ncbi:fumarylacetoacetate hydrolase family protein [Myxococcota bacterium]|nr:fumarylacetoacetate hydrolase family protein [Myxococcota bacterium]
MKRAALMATAALAIALLWLANELFRPFLDEPAPAPVICLDPEKGSTSPLGEPLTIYGLGLSYAQHIAESPGLYDPISGPPVFRKRPHSLNRSGLIPFPDRDTLLAGVRAVDPAHGDHMDDTLGTMPPLLDYEVEVGMVIMEGFPVAELTRPGFVPPLGFFVANDVTARILIALAPRFDDTVAFLAEGKGLPGFTPVGDTLWVPSLAGPDSWPCVELVTTVNGEVRQRAPSSDIIYTPRQILWNVARRFDLEHFEANTWILTGTPAGVAAQIPGFLQRAMALVDPPPETKFALMSDGAESNERFLGIGDVVTVYAGYLGSKTSTISEPTPPR